MTANPKRSSYDMDAFSLRDRVALLPGASSGIGLQSGRRVLPAPGLRLALAARRKERIDDHPQRRDAQKEHHAGRESFSTVLRPETFGAAFDAIVRELEGRRMCC